MLQIFLTITLATLFLIVFFFQWSWRYWKRRNVAILPTEFPFGNAKDLILQKRTFAENMADHYTEVKKKGVRYAGYYFLFKPLLMIVDLDLVKTILTKDFDHFTNRGNYVNEKVDPLSGHLVSLKGQKWKNLRTKLTPTFSSGKLKMMFPFLENCCNNLIDLIDKHVEDERSIEIHDAVARYTIDVIGSSVFGIDCNSLKNPQCEFRKYGERVLDSGIVNTTKFFFAFMLPEVLTFFNVPLFIKDVSDFFLNLVYATVKYRETNNVNRHDFMQLLMQLKKQDENENSKTALSMNELAAQVFAFFFAGYETSASTLTFCLYELAHNLEVQEKLRQEVKDVVGRNNSKIDYDALNKMPYMSQCINETLRMYPPVPFLNRECTETYRVPDTDLVLEKGTQIMIPTFGIQRDPEIYPDPLRFDPDRFSQENKDKRHPFAWLPFGDGPRICIGMRFGLMQIKLALAALLNGYEFSLNDKTEVPLKLNTKKTMLLGVRNGVWLNIRKLETNIE